jgi:hypothetical protein
MAFAFEDPTPLSTDASCSALAVLRSTLVTAPEDRSGDVFDDPAVDCDACPVAVALTATLAPEPAKAIVSALTRMGEAMLTAKNRTNNARRVIHSR